MVVSKIKLHLMPGFDRRCLPVPPPRNKAWWQDNGRTRNHAQHCQPLAMANSLGYYILSPATFRVEWDGDVQAEAKLHILSEPQPGWVTTHAAFGSFVVQPGFIPTTEEVGDFVYVKSLPNERCLPYTCMEALVEAWWSSGQFGLVFLLNQPGTFMVSTGQPIAQMFLYKAAGGFAKLEVTDQMLAEHDAWAARRYRPGYTKDLDYMHGRHPDGRSEPTHITSWTRDPNEHTGEMDQQ